jgi:hypothetical protein
MFCPSCGTENPSDAAFCRRCGQDLSAARAELGLEADGATSEAPPAPPRSKRRRLGIVLAIVAALALVGVGFGAAWFMRDGDELDEPASGTETTETVGDAGSDDVDEPATEDPAPQILWPVLVGDSWGYIDRTGTVVIEARFQAAESFSEGLAAVVDDSGRYGFIDLDGEWVIEPAFDYADDFSDGLAAVADDELYGYIDTSGEWVIEPRYTNAGDFSEGLAPAAVDWVYGYVDESGAWVIEPAYDYAERFTDGVAAVDLPEAGGAYIDRSGNVVMSGWRYAWPFSEGLAAVDDAERIGWIDRDGFIHDWTR